MTAYLGARGDGGRAVEIGVSGPTVDATVSDCIMQAAWDPL